jgi:hypothetical protein
MTLTPEQFNKLLTKQEFEERMKDYYTKPEMDQKFDQILGAVDQVVKKLDTIEHAFVSNQAAHDRFEQRISNIESHLGLNPCSVEYKK